VENFFVNMRNSIEEETLGVKNQVSLATCNNYISILQKTQQNE
jgi:hypothetical protein